MYKCIASVDGYPNEVYLGTAEGDFKQRFYNHWMSFNNEGHSTDTTIPKYVWEGEKKLIEMVHNQLFTSLFKYFQKISGVCKKKLKFLITPV